MALKQLIDDQIIIIDDHKRGTNEIKDWDNPENDVHIDKLTNFPIDGKKQDVRIKIPINSNRPIKIESNKKEINIPTKLKKEINKSLNNKRKRDLFIKDVINILKNFETSLNNVQRAHDVLEKLSIHFDLKWTGEEIANHLSGFLQSYTEVFTDNEGKEYFLKLDKQKITIGQNNGYAKQSKKINRN